MYSTVQSSGAMTNGLSLLKLSISNNNDEYLYISRIWLYVCICSIHRTQLLRRETNKMLSIINFN